VVARDRAELSLGTLADWRAMRTGPEFIRSGKAVLYPLASLDAWDMKNLLMVATITR
jgi:hypothetical protein